MTPQHSPVFVFVVVVLVRIIDILVRHPLCITLRKLILVKTAKKTSLDLSFVLAFLRAGHTT